MDRCPYQLCRCQDCRNWCQITDHPCELETSDYCEYWDDVKKELREDTEA